MQPRLIHALLLLLLWAGPPASSHAADPADTLDAAVHRVLDDDRGWTMVAEHPDEGIQVFSKPVPALGLTAFKGVKVLDPNTDPALLFRLLSDIDNHGEVTGTLDASEVVRRDGDVVSYYQVMKVPPLVPASQRYWISVSRLYRDVGGEPGHLKRAWSSAGPGQMQEVRGDLQQRYPRAVEVPVTHGSWEIDPQPDGRLLYIYRTVSDPGGSIPDGVARLLSSRTLPENMLSFEEAAQAGG